MTIVFQAAGTVVIGENVSSFTLPAPAGTLATDVVLAVFGFSHTVTVSPPAGWTLAKLIDDGLICATAVYWALGSATFGDWGAIGGDVVGFTLGYTGVDNVTPMDAAAVGQSQTSNVATAPSITTVTDNAMLVGCFSVYDPSAGVTPSWSAEFGTHRQSGGISSVETTSADACDAIQSVAGASGTKSATSSRVLANNGILVALRPGAPTPPPFLKPTFIIPMYDELS